MKKTTASAWLFFVTCFIGLNIWMVLGNVIGVAVYKQRIGDMTRAQEAVANNTALQMGLYMTMELLLLLFVYLFVTKREKQKFTASQLDLQWGTKSLRHLLTGVLIAILLAAGGWITVVSLGYTSFQGVSSHLAGNLLLMLIYTAFAGIIEEIVYRGYILNRLQKSQGPTLALIISSLMFALSHIGRYPSIVTLLFAFGMGMILGIAYLNTRSLYMPIGLHYMWDYLSKTIGDNKNDYSFVFKHLSETGISALTLGYLVFIILGCIVLGLIGKKATTKNSIAS